MTLRIVGAGLGRTGTLSLKFALEKLLGAPCYHMMELFSHPEHVGPWHAAARGQMPDWHRLFSGYAAAVAMYPGGCYSLVKEQVVRPLLLLIGDVDDWTLPNECKEMIEAMRGRGSDATIVLYPGAYHYFDVKGQKKTVLDDVENRNKPGGCCGATVSYDPSADADAHRVVLVGRLMHPGPAGVIGHTQQLETQRVLVQPHRIADRHEPVDAVLLDVELRGDRFGDVEPGIRLDLDEHVVVADVPAELDLGGGGAREQQSGEDEQGQARAHCVLPVARAGRPAPPRQSG